MTDIVKETIDAIKFGKITTALIHDNLMDQGYSSEEASSILRQALQRRFK